MIYHTFILLIRKVTVYAHVNLKCQEGILNTGAQNTPFKLTETTNILEITLPSYKMQTNNHIYEVSIRSTLLTLTQDNISGCVH